MSAYTVKFLSIYRFQADYQVIDRLTGESYRVRFDEPEGEIIGSYPEAPPAILAVAKECRDEHNPNQP